MEYEVYSLEDATYTLSVSVATTQSNRYMTVDVNGTTSVLTSANLPTTANLSTYTETEVGQVKLNKGFNRIRLNLKKQWFSSDGIHFDKFVLTK